MELKHFENDELCMNYVEAGTPGANGQPNGPLLHFAHANGFPAGVYEPLLEDLARDRRVIGLNICGQCECKKKVCAYDRRIRSWHKLAREMYTFLHDIAGGRRIVAAGHSIGAVVTMFCAEQHPELFSKIVLLDPVLLEPGLTRFIRLMNLLGQKRRTPLAVRARKRRNGWQSREEVYEYMRARPLFDNWDEASLRAYVEYGLKDSPNGGVELACSPEAEAQGYESYPADIWRHIGRLRVPVLFVRGEKSDVITPHARDLFLKLLPGAEYIELPGAGHLFPMQQPANVARIIREYTV